jgi:hypothetical protein
MCGLVHLRLDPCHETLSRQHPSLDDRGGKGISSPQVLTSTEKDTLKIGVILDLDFSPSFSKPPLLMELAVCSKD